MTDLSTDERKNENPYVGPRAFNIGEKIYGRDLETYKLVNMLSAQRIVLLYSPSGAGKTSLIRAALLPELIERDFHPRSIIRVNREPEIKQLPVSFNRYVFSMIATLEEGYIRERQKASQLIAGERHPPANETASPKIEAESLIAEAAKPMTEAELINLNLEKYLEKRPPADPQDFEVFIFDQFEEILTLDPTDQQIKRAFFEQIGKMLGNRSRWALFSMREDFVAALDPYLVTLPTRLNTTFRLDLLGVDAALQAIQEPASLKKVEFTEEAACLLIDDLRRVQVQHPDGRIDRQEGPYIEPVQLQVVCHRLWNQERIEPNMIDAQAVRTMGNVDEALADYYNEGMAQAAKESGVRERKIREWVERRLITKQGIRGQVLKGSEESEGISGKAIEALERAHLIRTEGRGGAFWLELSHDRLVQPVLKSNTAWNQKNLSMLERQAAIWINNKEEKSLLLRGKALEDAIEWSIKNPDVMTGGEGIEEEYLKACKDSQRQEEEARTLAEQAIKLEEQTRLGAKLRQRAVMLAGALTIALVLMVTAIYFGFAAQASAAEAKTMALAARINEQKAKSEASTASTAEARAQIENINAQTQARRAAAAEKDALLQKATAEAASIIANEQKVAADMERNRAEQSAIQADYQRKIALLNGLISSSLSNVDYRPDLALLLGVEAYNISPTLKAKSALLTALQHNVTQAVSPYPRIIPQQYSTIRVVAFHPKHNYLAWTTFSDTTDMWNLDTQQNLWDKKFLSKTASMAFSPDGSTLALGGYNPDVLLVNATTASVQKRLPTNILSMILGIAYSPNGKYLAAVGSGSQVLIWDTSNLDKPPLVFNHRENGSLRGLAWSPDSAYLAVGGTQPVVWIWDVANQGIANRLSVSQLSVNTLAWSPNGTWLAIGGNGDTNKNVSVWNTITREIISVPNFQREIMALAFSPDSKVLGIGGYNQAMTFVDTKNFLPISSPIQTDSGITTIAFSNGIPSLVAWGNGNANIQIYQLNDQKPFYQYLPNLGGAVQSIQYAAENTINVALNVRNYLRIYTVNLTNGARDLLFTPPEESSSISVLGSQNSLLLRSKMDGTVSVFDYAQKTTQERSFSILDSYRGTITSFAISSDGKTLAVAVCASRKPVTGECQENGIALHSLPDGKLIAGPGHFADLANGKEFPQQQIGAITSLAFDPSGQFLISGGSDQTIIFWNLTTGSVNLMPLIKHLYPVTSLAVNRESNLLASGDSNGNIILWDMAYGEPIGEPLLGLVRTVTSLAFSNDGRQLISGYESGDLFVWDIDIQSWIKRACDIAGRSLNEAEWNEYLNGEKFAPHCPTK